MLDALGLSSSAATLNALNKSLAIIEFDARGQILSANERFCELMGYASIELVGSHHSMLVDPRFAKSQEYKEFWAKLQRGEHDQQEYRRIAKGGRSVWIQASSLTLGAR